MPSRSHLLPAACLAASLACSNGPKAIRFPTPPPPAAGVRAAMDRQVRIAQEVHNAVDAGEGDFEARRLRELLVANPASLEARLQLAARYEALDMPELAIEHYRLAAERFPSEASVQIRLARALHGKRRTAEAAAGIESYLSAYAEAPAEAHSWAGILRDALGHHRVAEQHHRDALERSISGAAYLHNNLGQNLALQSRGPESKAEYRAALELEPSNVLARNNLAIALAADPAESAEVFEAGTNDPATAHSNLAAILMEQSRYAEARKELNLALGYKPDHMAALANLALVADLDGKPAQLPSPQDAAGRKTTQASAFRRFGRAVSRIFVASETAQPEQAVSRATPAKSKGKRPSD